LKRTRSGSSKLKQIFTKRLGLKLRWGGYGQYMLHTQAFTGLWQLLR
jgi:hypothetical protein